jgi:hypothetical protein
MKRFDQLEGAATRVLAPGATEIPSTGRYSVAPGWAGRFRCRGVLVAGSAGQLVEARATPRQHAGRAVSVGWASPIPELGLGQVFQQPAGDRPALSIPCNPRCHCALFCAEPSTHLLVASDYRPRSHLFRPPALHCALHVPCHAKAENAYPLYPHLPHYHHLGAMEMASPFGARGSIATIWG